MPEIEPSFSLVFSQDELHLVFDVLERVLQSKDIDTLSFLAETYDDHQSCRRRVERLQSHLARHMA